MSEIEGVKATKETERGQASGARLCFLGWPLLKTPSLKVAFLLKMQRTAFARLTIVQLSL
jgi:hypothetical protein